MVLLSTVIAAVTLSCGRAALYHRNGPPGAVHETGPPPHAPAHGYRHRHQRDGVELVFDAGRGVYVVVGLPACYFLDGVYYRRISKKWEKATGIEGDWKPVGRDRIPAGLRSEADDGNERSHGKAHGTSRGSVRGTPPASGHRAEEVDGS
jgi:hypothetical protein